MSQLPSLPRPQRAHHRPTVSQASIADEDKEQRARFREELSRKLAAVFPGFTAAQRGDVASRILWAATPEGASFIVRPRPGSQGEAANPRTLVEGDVLVHLDAACWDVLRRYRNARFRLPEPTPLRSVCVPGRYVHRIAAMNPVDAAQALDGLNRIGATRLVIKPGAVAGSRLDLGVLSGLPLLEEIELGHPGEDVDWQVRPPARVRLVDEQGTPLPEHRLGSSSPASHALPVMTLHAPAGGFQPADADEIIRGVHERRMAQALEQLADVPGVPRPGDFLPAARELLAAVQASGCDFSRLGDRAFQLLLQLDAECWSVLARCKHDMSFKPLDTVTLPLQAMSMLHAVDTTKPLRNLFVQMNTVGVDRLVAITGPGEHFHVLTGSSMPGLREVHVRRRLPGSDWSVVTPLHVAVTHDGEEGVDAALRFEERSGVRVSTNRPLPQQEPGAAQGLFAARPATPMSAEARNAILERHEAVLSAALAGPLSSASAAYRNRLAKQLLRSVGPEGADFSFAGQAGELKRHGIDVREFGVRVALLDTACWDVVRACRNELHGLDPGTPLGALRLPPRLARGIGSVTPPESAQMCEALGHCGVSRVTLLPLNPEVPVVDVSGFAALPGLELRVMEPQADFAWRIAAPSALPLVSDRDGRPLPARRRADPSD